MIEIKDAKLPCDIISADIEEDAHGDLVRIVIEETGNSGIIDITKQDAIALGKHLIELGKQ